MEARLQKIMAHWGIASRREAEEMIRRGRVQVNGVVANLGQKVDTQTDKILVDGQLVSSHKPPPLIYLLLNKPAGVVSTCHDPQGRKTVLDLLSPELRKGLGLHPVGRLDAESTGALILTNDGNLTFALTHPSHSIPKTYQVLVKGHPTAAVLERWRKGVVLEGRKTRPAQVTLIESLAKNSHLEIVLKEGRNRQIRRVAQELGYPVIKLHRSSIGPIQLKMPKLPLLHEGKYRLLNDAEISFLQERIKRLPVKDSFEVRSGIKA
ncbi:pseudouridine synthase [Umezakia ovalisporum]|jgi:23S rRNA pseudouridine2605 synthase/16S rRNA pseudouridine516 synthase|uniref:pseudouridine synthase n=1 Tax=Umezakia ovalisporum TaxID=75695 RepID=UPI00247455EB|nr:pseudouridine synthase [Umezakia ovalisporum]MBI1242454.1 pseudouridine synthase [Nostoc sp. RI_552]MDH6068357.1 rRNA pseudouridine synthase [Umezakia ovalisporum APH033B]MDH6079535.1 rRNA pseudouridine synthase [Umezakia ovalisporum FSS-45]MDH6085468.1 rRNA pseudouridine synthase [Umezakia ovalisporum TAC611]MDH6089551.1 rRNA pseudouridine synthase [Umezakia ovalisporum Ak1311]